MSLTFFSDHCVPAEIPAFLRDHGHSVILLRDVLPIRALDPDVIAKAQDIQAILLSLNGDFAEHRRLSASELRWYCRAAIAQPSGSNPNSVGEVCGVPRGKSRAGLLSR